MLQRSQERSLPIGRVADVLLVQEAFDWQLFLDTTTLQLGAQLLCKVRVRVDAVAAIIMSVGERANNNENTCTFASLLR